MIRERRIFKRIAAELARNPSWKIIVLKRSWLCPYCGDVGAHELRIDEDLETRIAQHFGRHCPAFRNGARGGRGGAAAAAAEDVEPKPLDHSTLEKRATLINLKYRVKKLLAREPGWRLTDLDGHWICPYCARCVSGVDFPQVLAEVESQVEGAPSATGSGASAEARALNKVVRHLLDCEECRQGQGKERPVSELKARRDEIDRKKRVRRLRGEIEGRVEWRFAVQPAASSRAKAKSWVCPFCAQPTEIPFDKAVRVVPDAVVERIGDHLAGCAAYRVLEGKPRTERYLKDRVIAINRQRTLERLKRKLERHATWQVTDADANWYCAYCARPTGVRLPDPARVTEAQVNEVWTHLSSCPAYAGKRAQLKSPSYLRNVVALADRTIRLRREVKAALVEDPRFGVSDVYGSWLCPYCRKVQKPISVPRDLSQTAFIEKTIEQIVSHLYETCKSYVEGQEPEASAPELRRIADHASRASAAAAKAPGIVRFSSDDDERDELLERTIANLKSAAEAKRELTEVERRLQAAGTLQRSLLPRVPEIPGFEFGIVYSPCQSVGGDFYHFIPVSERELGIAIGDVAGHDVEAALLMGIAKKLLEIHGRRRSSPGQTLRLANQDMFPDLEAKSFVTAFYGILDFERKRLKFARAGHNPLILFNPARRPPLQVLDSTGMALGMDAGPVFAKSLEELEIALRAGDVLLQYTDGVPESMNHDREEFGLERLYGAVERFGKEEVEYLLYQIERAIADFREGARQKDDITMVAIKVQK